MSETQEEPDVVETPASVHSIIGMRKVEADRGAIYIEDGKLVKIYPPLEKDESEEDRTRYGNVKGLYVGKQLVLHFTGDNKAFIKPYSVVLKIDLLDDGTYRIMTYNSTYILSGSLIPLPEKDPAKKEDATDTEKTVGNLLQQFGSMLSNWWNKKR